MSGELRDKTCLKQDSGIHLEVEECGISQSQQLIGIEMETTADAYNDSKSSPETVVDLGRLYHKIERLSNKFGLLSENYKISWLRMVSL